MSDSDQHIDLKGSVFTLLVLHPLSGDLEAIGRQLDDKLFQLPGFFTDAPIVIDLQRLEGALSIDALCTALRARKMVPVAVRNADEEQREEALAARLGILAATRAAMPEAESPAQPAGESTPEPEAESEPSAEEPQAESRPEPPPQARPAPRPARIVTTPVRSGQQVYSPGDLILLAPVSSGGEVLADGHIHAYAALRGRALAGVRGDEGARIFCRSLEAELLSVAGNYRLADDFDEAQRGHPVEVRLTDDERLEIRVL